VNVLLQRLIILMLLLLSLGGAGQISAARAAPPAQEVTNMRFYLNISYPQTLCAGREYSILVTPLVELDGKRANGEKFNYQDRIIPGVEITAEITDTKIATVDPAKPQSKKSGYLPGDLLGTSSLDMQERLGNLGEVVFKIKAKKAGSTNLFLTAKVPRQWSGGRDRYFGPQGMPVGGAIKVVNCKYEVTMIYNWQYSFPAVNMWLIGTMKKVPLTIESESLTGTGQIDFMRVVGGNPHCTYNISTGKSTVDMAGSFSQDPSGNDQLKITFNYGPMSEVVASTCTVPHFGTRSGTTDWSGQPPVAAVPTAVFPAEGGSATFMLQLGGSLTVTLKPVSEQGGK
jgi:hypothetical protein